MPPGGELVRRLDIETIAPQHGAILPRPRDGRAFIAWCEALPCGVDLIDDLYGRRQPGEPAMPRVLILEDETVLRASTARGAGQAPGRGRRGRHPGRGPRRSSTAACPT
jgi:hypothetical protein